MLTANLKADLDGLQDLLTSISDRLDQPDDLGQIIGDEIRKDYALRFDTSPPSMAGGEVWGGTYWRALNEGYLLSRPDRRQGQVLIDSGATRRAFTDEFDPNHVSELEPTEGGFIIRVGANLDHLEKLQETWKIAIWHPVLLENVANKVLEWLISGKSTGARV